MKQIFFFIFLLFAFSACQKPENAPQTAHSTQSWEQITAAAKGKTVTMMMWQGDPLINRYMKEYVVPTVQKEYDVTLNIVAGQGNDIVNALMTEMEAGKTQSAFDMMWINGETFYQLRQIKALHHPFVEQLPHNTYIDWENPFVGYDFQQPVNGYEMPWGNVQLALIYNAAKVSNPPMTMTALETWVKANPGKFTIGNDFTGMTLLKSWLIHLANQDAGNKDGLKGAFDRAKYEKYSSQLWAYLQRIKPYLWNQGKSFPASVAQMHQLFANGELWFTMSNNDGEVDNKILQGIFDQNSRAFVPETGTIQNSHYLGIVKHSAQKEAAMVVTNFMISPEAQWKKMQPAVWGDGTILSMKKLSKEWQDKFNSIPGRVHAPARADIQSKALAEPAPEYMIHLFEDFRKNVMEK